MNAFYDTYRCIGRDLFGVSSLWLADDQLVYVKGRGILMAHSEEYKRFRLAEIQTISIAKTSGLGRGILYSLFLIIGLLPATLLFVFTESLDSLTIAAIACFVAVTLAALALLLRHLILGPTCICELQTRFTRERLRPLNRYHRALEFVDKIEGQIRERQASIVTSRGEGPRKEQGQRVASAAAEFFQIPRSALLTYGLFAFLGIAALTTIHLESPLLTGLILLLLFAGSFLLTFALIAVARKPTPESLRGILWVLLGLHFFVIGIGMVYYVTAAMNEPSYTLGLSGVLEAFTAIVSDGGIGLYGVFVALFLGYSVVGLWGGILSAKWRKQIRLAASLVEARDTTEQSLREDSA